jgi:adenylate cyclase
MVAILLAGHSRALTILFADIKGCSVFCKKADALQIQRVLRDDLTAMTAIILEHGGTLDQYMGDGIMALFGDAEPEGAARKRRKAGSSATPPAPCRPPLPCKRT